ncbi:MAG: type III pantothenate kinase, partial [candidate division WOR-3 bacterium]|nr:type III pantothenate kinase [candidate division WOR-3 bacterium]
MIILVDVGNSFTKVATAERGEILSIARLGTRHERTPDEIFIEFKTLGIQEPKDAVICSVVPGLTGRFVEMFRSRFNLGEPLVVTPYVNTGITILYRNLSNLGADRIANAVGAYFDYGKDVAIVDFGTATTIDFVTSNGEYLGGIIAPGLESSLDLLVSSTSRLFEIKPKKPSRYVGRSTEECLQSGSYLLTVGLI